MILTLAATVFAFTASYSVAPSVLPWLLLGSRVAELGQLRSATVLIPAMLLACSWHRRRLAVRSTVVRGLEVWELLSSCPHVHTLFLIVFHHQVLLVLSEGLVEHVDVVLLRHEGLLYVLEHVFDLVHGQRAVLLLLVRAPYDLQLELPQLFVHLPMQLPTACLAMAAQSTIFALEQFGRLICATALPAVAECLAVLFALVI